MEAKDLTINDINIGDKSSFERTFTENDIQVFAGLSGDVNPLHVDERYAKTTIFKQRLVHGLLVGSLCSTLVGMYLPGKRCLYLKQKLSFKKPVFIRDTLNVFGWVVAKSEVTKILTIIIHIKRGKEIVLEGEAIVQVL